MVLKRYLIYYSYIGTSFRGVQRQVTRGPNIAGDPSTVQGVIEYCLARLKPNNEPITLLASRTDRGVHAIKSALTVDLDLKVELPTKCIHQFMNRFFYDTSLPVRVNEVRWVPWEFNCRKAPLWRRYVYRFAIPRANFLPDQNIADFITLPYPIVEHKRCYFVSDSKFDFERVAKACEIFVGMQDYIAFLGKPRSTIHGDDLNTFRCMLKVFLERAHPYLPTDLNDHYDYYHLTVEGKSFIYNQVRKMVAILLAVGQGKMVEDDIRLMFIDPSPASWPAHIETAPPFGLYLTDIQYDPKELELPKDIKEEFREPQSLTPKQQKIFDKNEYEMMSDIKKAKEERTF